MYQQNSKDCGVACLLSIIKFYKGNNSFENLRYLTKCDNNGITALNLIETAKKLGFNVRALRLDLDDLINIKVPFIAHMILENGYMHYVIVNRIEKNIIYVFDPAIGNVKYKKLDFIKV